MDTVFDDLARRGYSVIADALTTADLAAPLAAIDQSSSPASGATRAGRRDLLALNPAIRELATHPAVAGWPLVVLGPGAFAVRALYFDETPETNWKVSWHQDLTIPTLGRADVHTGSGGSAPRRRRTSARYGRKSPFPSRPGASC